MKRTTAWMAAAVMAAGLCMVSAQAKGEDSKAAATSSDMAGKSMDVVLSIYEKNIVGAAEAMPADKFEFAPKQDDFKAGFKVDFSGPKPVATFGAQVRHVAQANYSFFSSGGAKPDRDVKAISELKGRDESVKALKDSFAFAHKAMLEMTAASGFKEIKGFRGQPSTAVAMYAFGLAHMGDHYGQLVEYLRMNDIIPPASRPSSKGGD
jgi:hypothetical protein